MATLAELEIKSPTRAPAVMTLMPSDFASDYDGKPNAPVEIGLRLPSEDDVQIARTSAERYVDETGVSDDNRADAFADALMARGCARCICNPINVHDGHPVLPLAEDTITQAFPSGTIRRIYDRIERLQVEQAHLVSEADDDTMIHFAHQILNGTVSDLDPISARTVRRFVSYCLDLMPEE